MKANPLSSVGLAAAMLCFGASPAWAGVGKDLGKSIDKGMDEVQHALGWDTLNLKVVEQDASGRATLERDSNTINKIERRTSYHKNGNRDSQTVIVIAKASGKTLFTGKNDWSTKGDLENAHSQDDEFNGDGRQMKGLVVDKEMKHGRLMAETRKKFAAGTNSWGDDYKQTIAYYDDGDKKERLTEYPAADKKTREVWSEKKGAMGRKIHVSKWNSSTASWD